MFCSCFRFSCGLLKRCCSSDSGVSHPSGCPHRRESGSSRRYNQKWPGLHKTAKLMLLMYAPGELSRSVCILGNAPALGHFRTPDQAERTPSEQIQQDWWQVDLVGVAVDTSGCRLVLDTEAQVSSYLELEHRPLAGTVGLLPMPPHTTEEAGVPQVSMSRKGVRLPSPW